MAYKLPELEYDYSALAPYIDAETMKIHHSKHHAAYIAKVNAALEKTEWENQDISILLKKIDHLPSNKQLAVRNNGGGHANHSLFWKLLSRDPLLAPTGSLNEFINKTFGSLDKFKDLFAVAATTQFGSGWAWLVLTSESKLAVYGTANQDSPLMKGDTPLLGLDVWEHAYYLKYQNRRPEYIDAFWNVLDWKAVMANYEVAK